MVYIQLLFFLIQFLFSLQCSNKTSVFENRYNEIEGLYKTKYDSMDQLSIDFFETLATNYFQLVYDQMLILYNEVNSNYQSCINKKDEAGDDDTKKYYNSMLSELEDFKNKMSTYLSNFYDKYVYKQNVSLLKATNIFCLGGNYTTYNINKTTFVTRIVPLNISVNNTFILNFSSANVTIGNLDFGGITIGICTIPSTNSCTPSSFTGINIAYFGDNCYHVDYFVDNVYTNTGRSCLSKYELYSIRIDLINNELAMKLKNEEDYFFNKTVGGTGIHKLCGALLNQITVLRFDY